MKNRFPALAAWAALALILGACTETPQTPKNSGQNAEAPKAGAESASDSQAELVGAKPKEANKAEGAFPEVDIATAQLSPLFERNAGDLPTYVISLNDGHMDPRVLVVPTDTKFRIRIYNKGTKPVEFESVSLRQEKVLYLDGETRMVVMPQNEGKYDFFDDFNNGFPGYIVAKANAGEPPMMDAQAKAAIEADLARAKAAREGRAAKIASGESN